MISKNQQKLIRSLELKKNRRREGLFVAEGPKVVDDLLRAGYTARSIFATADYEKEECLRITEDELERISFLQHPQQVLALFEIPETTHTIPLPNKDGQERGSLSLALDGIQDPGNLGTIIRIADWFGIDTIYCSPDTADAYNPKVVQATMGSLAHVHIYYCDLVRLLEEVNCPIYGTLLDGNDIYCQTLKPYSIIVMGNEGNGISPEVRQLVTDKLLIPNYHTGEHTADSLNVAIATAITCAEFRRQNH